MGSRPATCSTGDVCMALDYLEDPAVHGITTQVCGSCPEGGSPRVSVPHGFKTQVCTAVFGWVGVAPMLNEMRGNTSGIKAASPIAGSRTAAGHGAPSMRNINSAGWHLMC